MSRVRRELLLWIIILVAVTAIFIALIMDPTLGLAHSATITPNSYAPAAPSQA